MIIGPELLTSRIHDVHEHPLACGIQRAYRLRIVRHRELVGELDRAPNWYFVLAQRQRRGRGGRFVRCFMTA